MTPKFVSFSTAMDTKIYVNMSLVTCFQPGTHSGTTLSLSTGGFIHVCESMEAVAQKFAAA